MRLLELQRHVNDRYIKRNIKMPYRRLLHCKSSLVATHLFFGKHDESPYIYFSSCPRLWLPRGGLIVLKWLDLKGADSVYEFICVWHRKQGGWGRRSICEGAIYRSRFNFYANLTTRCGRSCLCLAWAGEAGLRCRNAQEPCVHGQRVCSYSPQLTNLACDAFRCSS